MSAIISFFFPQLMDKIIGDAEPGQKEALIGYLRSKQERYEKSQQLFAEDREKGLRCIPDSYHSACEC